MLAGILNKIPYHRVTNALRKYLGPLVSRSEYYENDLGTRHLLNDLNNCKEQPLEETLLQKASIVTTPTAYDNGSLHSVKPVQSFGSELSVNGDFATDSDWTKGTNWSIANGKATVTNSTTSSIFQDILNVSKKYKVTFEITEITSGSLRIGIGQNFSDYFTQVGTYTYYGKIFLDTLLRINPSSGTNASIDNVSVKEVIDADFDFTRGSAATRVNENFLVKNVQILSDDLVQNGDFSQIGSEEITNGDFSQIGSELVVNGGFDTDSNWSKGTGWSIANGKANCDGSFSSLIQFGVYSNPYNKFFVATINVSNYTSGHFSIGIGGYNFFGRVESNGEHKIYFNVTNSQSNDRFYINGQGFNGSIDNVSVKEVGQDWTFSDGATITDNGARIISDGAYQYIVQNNVLTVGKQYKIQYEIVENNSGNLKLQTSFNIIPIPSTVGIHTIYGEALQTFLTIERSGVCDITITNISVKEVGQNWTFGTGWSIEDGKAIRTAQSGSTSTYQSVSFSANKTYKIQYDLDITAGSFKIRIGGGTLVDTPARTTSGTYTEYIVANSGNNVLNLRADDGAFVGSIDNVSVIEVTDDTDLPRIDYTNGTGSLLLEPQSTNSFIYSQDFTNSYWGHNTDVTVTNSSELAPNGQLDANLIEYDGGGYSFIRVGIGVPSTAVTLSVFAKKGNWRYLGFRNFQIAGDDHTVFDFDTETFPNINAGQTASFEIFPNGWYRIKVTQPSPEASGLAGFAITNSTGSELNTTGGQVANVHLFGAQLEQLSYATSYIPTSGSSVTRNADACNNAGSSDLINSTEGVLYAEIAALANYNSNRLISLSNGTTSNVVKIGFLSSATNYTIFSEVRSGAVLSAYMTYNFGAVTPTITKIAIKYKENNFSLYVDGVERATDTSGIVPTGLNKLSFDRADGMDGFEGNVKCVAVFKEALTDEELACLTSHKQDTSFYYYVQKLKFIGATLEHFDDFYNKFKKLF